MSKSKHNGIDPNDMFNEYGVDTTRLLVLADVSPTSHRNWNTNSILYLSTLILSYMIVFYSISRYN